MTQKSQVMSTQAAQLPQSMGTPAITMVENTMTISGNGHTLNSIDVNTLISTNNAMGVDTNIVSAPGTIIENQVFVNTTITMDSSDNSTIRNNIFRDHFTNGTTKSRDMVTVTNSMNITIENNVFNNITNIYTNGFDLMGIYLDTVQHANIYNNTFTHFSAPGMHHTAVYTFYSSYVTVENNTIRNNNASLSIDGIWLEETDHGQVTNNTIDNLLTTSGQARALELYAGNHNVFDQNTVSNIFANQSITYGYYLGQTDEVKIIQAAAYHAMIPDPTISTTYYDILFWETNHTSISSLNNMNFTLVISITV